MTNDKSETNDESGAAGDNGSPENTKKNDLSVPLIPEAGGFKAYSNEDDLKEGTKVSGISNLKEDTNEATTPTAEASADPETTKTTTEEVPSEMNEESKNSPVAVAVSPDSHSDGDSNNNSKIQEDGAEKKSSKKKSPPDSSSSGFPQRPVKRARTAYFIFMESKRPEVQAKVYKSISMFGFVSLFEIRLRCLDMSTSPCSSRALYLLFPHTVP